MIFYELFSVIGTTFLITGKQLRSFIFSKFCKMPMSAYFWNIHSLNGGRTEWTATQLDTHDLNERPSEFLWRTVTDFGCERQKINRRTATNFRGERPKIYGRTARTLKANGQKFIAERPQTLEANGHPYKIIFYKFWWWWMVWLMVKWFDEVGTNIKLDIEL